MSGVIAEIFFANPYGILFVFLLVTTHGELNRVRRYTESWDLAPLSEDLQKRGFDTRILGGDDGRKDCEGCEREGDEHLKFWLLPVTLTYSGRTERVFHPNSDALAQTHADNNPYTDL